jgi:hypothetical protein
MVDRGLVVGQNFGRIAAEYRKVAEIFGQRHRVLQLRAELRVKNICVVRQAAVGRLGQGLEIGVLHQPPHRQRRASNQKVQDQADDGLEEDEQQPTLRRVGRAAEGHDDNHR